MQNFYLVTPLVGVGIGTILAVLVILQRRRSALHRALVFFLINVSLWSFFTYMMRKSALENSLQWEKGIFIVLPLISVSFFHSVLLLINAAKNKWPIVLGYSLALAFIALTPTKLLLTEMKPMWYGNAFVSGPLLILYIVVFYGIVSLGLYELIRAARKSESPLERNRYIYVAIGACFCLLGLFVDLLAARGIHIYPLGIFTNILFLILCSYAILKYHLWDIYFIIRRSAVYASISAIAVGLIIAVLYIAYLVGFGEQQLLSWKNVAFIIIIAILLQPIIIWLQNRLDRLFYRSKYDYLKALETLSDNTKTITDLNFISEALVKTVAAAMKTDWVLLLLPDTQEKYFIPAAIFGNVGYRSISLPLCSSLTYWLQNNAHFMTHREMEVMPQFQSLTDRERQLMTEFKAEIFMPLLIRDKLTGIIVLGRKLSDQDYSMEEIRMLRVVASQMATTLDNARLYKLQTEKYFEQSFLTKLGMVISSELDIDKIYNSLVKELSGFIPLDCICVKLASPSDELTSAPFIWIEETLDKSVETNLTVICNSSKIVDEVVYEANLETSSENYAAALLKIGIRSIVRLPLSSKGILLGYLSLGSIKAQAYSEDNLRLLKQVALQIATAIDNSRLYKLEMKAREQLQKEYEERVEFVDALIHEVKTPLTAMIASTELLKDELASDTSALSELASNMDIATQNLDRRITELIQFTKLQHTEITLNLGAVNINELIHEAVFQITGLMINKKQTITVELEPSLPPIRGDSDRVMQILLNLLTNAIKYGPIGDSLFLKSDLEDGHVIIEVTNGAQPLTLQEQELVFTPYQKGRRKGGGGLGLGLYICKKLVEIHGGRIWVETKTKGNNFKFTLPTVGQEVTNESIGN